MRKPESKLQKKIRSQLEKVVGGFWRKVWGGPYQAVFLDLIGCVDGLYFELEVKVPGKEHNTSALQDLTIKDIRKAGGVTGVVSSPQEAIQLVRKAQARAKKLRGLHNKSRECMPVLRTKNGKDLRDNGRSRKTRLASRSRRRPFNVDWDRLGSSS